MAGGPANQFCYFNVGGCFFSIPQNCLSHLQDSVLFEDSQNQRRWFIDRDGCTFRHVNYYLQTGKLATSCASELNILYELTTGLRLTSLLQALENFQSGKHYLRARPVDLQVAERASMNYWKTRICNKQLEPIASPVSSVHDAVPLGLISTPLVDGDEEVLYCFLPMEQVRLYPTLVTPDNLLWLCDDVVIIECDSPLFRFIVNFIQTGKILLPEQFSDHERLNTEAKSAGMTDFMKALQKIHEVCYDGDSPAANEPSTPQPLYVMTFDLLVRYQDSALGQLYIDSNLEGSKLYMSGNGVVFQHVQNWLGTCRLPLTESRSELQELCEYLDKQDEAYQAFKEVVWEFSKRTTGGSFTAWPWSASVATFTIYKVVKVYVGTHWYATYLQTLLKYPELLSNLKKTSWIVFGESLLIKGDGQMFRHVLNFLRCGRLLLPSEFREWQLLRHEVEEFQIPSLSGALEDCTDYRAWTKTTEPSSHESSSSTESLLIYNEDQQCFVGISFHEESMDLSPVRWQDSDNSEDPFISVDEDVCLSDEPEGAQSQTDTVPNISEGSYVCTEVTVDLSQDPSPLQMTGHVGDKSLPFDRLSRIASSAPTCKISVPLRNMVQTVDESELPAQHCSATQKHDDASQLSIALWQMLKWRPVDAESLSSVPQSSMLKRTAEGVGQLSGPLQRMFQMEREEAGYMPAPLQSLVQMVESVFQTGPRTEPWGMLSRPTARAETTPAASSRGSTSVSLLTQASARLSALSALLSRQRLPGGPPGETSLTQRVEGRDQSRAKPYSMTQQGGEGGCWSWSALRGCMSPVRGSVVRVDHPAVLGRGEPGGYFVQSVVYTGSSSLYPGYQLHNFHDPREDEMDPKSNDVAFACFSMSYEEMVYGRQCHAFLTGIILDSIRLQDPRDCTLKIANLVYLLWTGQTKVEDFVSELMNIISPGRQSREQLQQWLNFTLTLAQRYTECLEKLGKQHCHTATLFPEDRTTAVSAHAAVPFSGYAQYNS